MTYTLIMGGIGSEMLGLLMRWLHIASAVLIIGGIAYARIAVMPALEELDRQDRPALLQQLAARYRAWIYAAPALLIGSGLYTLLSNPGHTRYYYSVFAVKFLLALHVFTAAIMSVTLRQDEAALSRRMSGIVISGLVIIALSAYLRRIF